MQRSGSPDRGSIDTSSRPLPLTVVMITLNEAHTIEGALKNLEGWAGHVVIVDSYSKDETVGIALRYGARVVQRAFRGFGDQWNFALSLPIETPWVMKMDPDERVSERLKDEMRSALRNDDANGYTVGWRLWFMKTPLPVVQPMLRVWRNGTCRFTDSLINEHPVVEGMVGKLTGELEHHDSPHLDHWFHKQNAYTTAEALVTARELANHEHGGMLARQARMRRWFDRMPFRFQLYFLYCLLWRGAWRAGKAGWIWSHLRSEYWRMRDYKLYEMRKLGLPLPRVQYGAGNPDPCVPQF